MVWGFFVVVLVWGFFGFFLFVCLLLSFFVYFLFVGFFCLLNLILVLRFFSL